ncbi:MAG: HNH endonuclease family protein [Bdellovibrionia bacterium]
MKKTLLSIILIICARVSAEAQTFSHSFKIDEPTNLTEPTSVSPFEVLALDDEDFAWIRKKIFSLLKFSQLSQAWGPTREPYQRVKHFRGWLRDWENPSCRNTRALVLKRDSLQQPVEYSDDGCRVVAGEWEDPFTGLTHYNSNQVQIDHFVPLKNAYVSGADQWSGAQRCLYANFLGNDFHLLSITGYENSRKGDRGPEAYLPPNSSYQCRYVSQWLQIKLLWQLRLNPDEVQAIQKTVRELHCDRKLFEFSKTEIQRLRKLIADTLYICQS